MIWNPLYRDHHPGERIFWWEAGDSVTLITRPRRFGKTLNISMMNRFFSNKFAGNGKVFEGLSIWKDEKYRELQGTYPVISLSFANVKEKDYLTTREKICQLLINLYSEYEFIRNSGVLGERDREFFDQVKSGMGGGYLEFAACKRLS